MGSISSFFKLIRYKHLLVYALCLILIRTNIIDIFYAQQGLQSTIPMHSYILWVLSFIVALAACYIVNDYNDQEIDDFNRLDKNIFVGNTIKPRTAKRSFFILIALSFVLGIVSQMGFSGVFRGGFSIYIYLILMFYSVKIKRVFLLKNILIALIPIFFLFAATYTEYNILQRTDMLAGLKDYIHIASIVVIWLALFMFLVSFIREVVKDMQDRVGDEKFGVHTLIVKCGEKKTKQIVYVLTGLLMACVLAFQIIYCQISPMSFIGGVTILVQIPLIYFLVEFKKASIVQDYGFLADLLDMIFISILFVTFFASKIIVCGTVI
ncbi:MAG: UbiA family prenyltransferase [Bacteroidales bacterium]|jgi:4-hydroxybenzoate polyprenyltransferase|nr:UbiA family prenyltransferase [Bacteroidales bacterium]